MEAVCSFETVVTTDKTKRRHNTMQSNKNEIFAAELTCLIRCTGPCIYRGQVPWLASAAAKIGWLNGNWKSPARTCYMECWANTGVDCIQTSVQWYTLLSSWLRRVRPFTFQSNFFHFWRRDTYIGTRLNSSSSAVWNTRQIVIYFMVNEDFIQ